MGGGVDKKITNMRVFSFFDQTYWLQKEIKKYAEEIEEIYNEETSDYEVKKIRDVHLMLVPQIETIYRALDENYQKEIIRFIEYLRKEAGPIMNRKSKNYFNRFVEHLIAVIFENAMFRQIAEKDWELFKQYVYPYHTGTNKKLRLEKWLGIQQDQNVFLVVDPETNIKWVMKWEETKKKEENQESIEYRRLEQMGAQCPLRLDGYYMLNFSVLIIEFLQPLDVTDSAIELARQLLMTQLKYIHVYACYFDLKTDNIRKRSSNPPLYFIIDMNLSKEPVSGGGYKRLHYTPLYSSQTFPRLQMSTAFQLNISTYKHDLIELLYVVHQMIAKRAYESKQFSFDPKGETYQKGQYGLLPGDFFADPDRMNNDPIGRTDRGWRAAKSMLEYPLDILLSGITWNYITYIQQLPNFAPPNVHEKIFSTLNQDYYTQFMKQTGKSLPIQCQICSNISSFRCGDCYHDSVFLCSTTCAKEHKCH